MKFIKDTTWPEVFQGWKEREASNPGWINCATKIKGWPDWKSWRSFTASQFQADKREWQIFEFTDPLNEIPDMLIGPYQGWQKKLPQKNSLTFKDLLNIKEQYNSFSKNKGVLSIMAGLPFSTAFIGLIRDDLDKLVCLEGHHRATAIALTKKQGKQINFKNNIKIALAYLAKDEIDLLDKMLARGSAKNPLAN